MVPLFKPLLRRLSGQRSIPDVPLLPRPDPPVCLIGDLHGRADLLDVMLTSIAARPRGDEVHLVFVGDLIDRGPDSAGVLRRVHDLCLFRPGHVTCLMGNHERMMLDFVAAPFGPALRWLQVGGIATVQSFGLTPRTPADMPPDRHFANLSNALQAALLPDLLPWLTALPLYWLRGGLAVVHADALPDLPIQTQPDQVLLWGRKGATSPRPDGLWLAHGHVIVPEVTIRTGRIAVDTGAYRTGRLSALWLDAEGARVIEAVL